MFSSIYAERCRISPWILSVLLENLDAWEKMAADDMEENREKALYSIIVLEYFVKYRKDMNSRKWISKLGRKTLHRLGFDVSSEDRMEISTAVRIGSWDLPPGPKPGPQLPRKKKPQIPWRKVKKIFLNGCKSCKANWIWRNICPDPPKWSAEQPKFRFRISH